MRMNYLDSHSQGCRIQHIFSSPNDESWWPQDAFSEILHGISSEMQAWNLDVVDIPLNNRSSIGYFSYERNNLVLVIATFAFSFFFSDLLRKYSWRRVITGESVTDLFILSMSSCQVDERSWRELPEAERLVEPCAGRRGWGELGLGWKKWLFASRMI